MSKFNDNITSIFKNLEEFISSKTVIGEPITIGDTIILPLIDISFGIGAVGQEQDGSKESLKSSEDKQGLASGAKITPSAVIIVNQKTSSAQLINVKNQDSLNKLIDMTPGLITKIKSLFSKDEAETNEENESAEIDTQE